MTLGNLDKFYERISEYRHGNRGSRVEGSDKISKGILTEYLIIMSLYNCESKRFVDNRRNGVSFLCENFKKMKQCRSR